jgi:Phage integrase, N-terminal SAM-like domain
VPLAEAGPATGRLDVRPVDDPTRAPGDLASRWSSTGLFHRAEEAVVRGYVVAKGRRFYAVIYEGIDPLTGRERRRWLAAGCDRAAAERLASKLGVRASLQSRDRGPSLARYLLEQWLPAKRVSLRPSTWDGYRRSIERHVVPRVGHIPVRRIRVEHLEALVGCRVEVRGVLRKLVAVIAAPGGPGPRRRPLPWLWRMRRGRGLTGGP